MIQRARRTPHPWRHAKEIINSRRPVAFHEQIMALSRRNGSGFAADLDAVVARLIGQNATMGPAPPVLGPCLRV